jgi:hypothetical protein
MVYAAHLSLVPAAALAAAAAEVAMMEAQTAEVVMTAVEVAFAVVVRATMPAALAASD